MSRKIFPMPSRGELKRKAKMDAAESARLQAQADVESRLAAQRKAAADEELRLAEEHKARMILRNGRATSNPEARAVEIHCCIEIRGISWDRPDQFAEIASRILSNKVNAPTKVIVKISELSESSPADLSKDLIRAVTSSLAYLSETPRALLHAHVKFVDLHFEGEAVARVMRIVFSDRGGYVGEKWLANPAHQELLKVTLSGKRCEHVQISEAFRTRQWATRMRQVADAMGTFSDQVE